MATPIGASPDEPAHLIKAASVVRGQFIGEGSGAQGETVQVPQYIAFTHAQTCYAFEPDTSAECMLQVPGDASELVSATTTAGLYNPAYYLLVGWPSLVAQDSGGIYGMRVISGIIVSLLLALAFALITTWPRSTIPMIGLIVAVTPMFLFLNGSVNPNSVEIAATLTAFVGVLTVVRKPDARHLSSQAVVIFAAAALAANMRGLSLLWLVVALLTPLLLLDLNRIRSLLAKRPVQVTMTGIALAAVAAAGWLFATSSLDAAFDDVGSDAKAPGAGTSPFLGFIWTLFSTFHYAQGVVGVFGWLDTPAPQFVFFTWSLLAGGLLMLAFVLLRGRQFLVTATLTTAVILLPPLLQGIYITSGGVIWQGRYILPLFACLMVAAASGLSDRIALSNTVKTRLLVIVLGLWAVGQFQSFATALRRYAVGLDHGWLSLLQPQWQPPGGIWLSLLAFALLLAMSTLAVHLMQRRVPEFVPLDIDHDVPNHSIR